MGNALRSASFRYPQSAEPVTGRRDATAARHEDRGCHDKPRTAGPEAGRPGSGAAQLDVGDVRSLRDPRAPLPVHPLDSNETPLTAPAPVRPGTEGAQCYINRLITQFL